MAHLGGSHRRALLAGGIALLLTNAATPSGATGAEVKAAASTERATSAPTRVLLPDLVALRARDLHIRRTSTGRRLRFETALGSVGNGPVEVRSDRREACPVGKRHASQVLYRDVNGNGRYDVRADTWPERRAAGCMVFHPTHAHWHFEAASSYTLYRVARPNRAIVAHRKMSFCLMDSRRVPPSYGSVRYPQRYADCGRTKPQGISIGWVDVYGSYLPGQALPLPRRLADGLYCLRVEVDPLDQLLETRNDNNSSLRAFLLRGDKVRYHDSTRCRSAG